MIAMKMMSNLISRLRFCFLKTKILVNTDVYFATTKITTPSINVWKLPILSQGKKLLNKNVYALCA